MRNQVDFARWRAGRGATRATALSLLAALALLSTGCANDGPRIRRVAPWVFRSARHVGVGTGRPAPAARPAGDESAALVVGQIQAAGYRFGTDGSPGALWGYMRTTHRLVDPDEARPGDVLFFDTRGRDDQGPPACADRVALVEGVEAGGRISFVELRGGRYQRGYLHPRYPLTRRDQGGQVINSFLHPKHIDDAQGTRYFAGEMLCGVARMRGR
ncbi:MAG TPA: hypothetical protein VFH68_05365 [Polyangia bacterium]|jgi:hypothetical protein|nr:hypothetical protein [Polyangia bacterium]